MLFRQRQQLFIERSIAALREHGNTLGVAATGCHALGTLIMMHDGSLKRVEEVVLGDRLMGPDSSPRVVQALHRGQEPLVRINPQYGEPFVVNKGHILSLKNSQGRVINITVEELREKSIRFKKNLYLYRTDVRFHRCDNPSTIDPYFLGLILANGQVDQDELSIAFNNLSVRQECINIAKASGYCVHRIHEHSPFSRSGVIYFKFQHNRRLAVELEALNLTQQKSLEDGVPDAYRYGSYSVRRGVLAALLDAAGDRGRYTVNFYAISHQLAADVEFIARSVGFYTKRSGETIEVYGDFKTLPLRCVHLRNTPLLQKQHPLLSPFSLTTLDEGDYYGFTVDKDHLYVMGDFTVTHNSGKTIMLSGVIKEWLGNTDKKACVLSHRDEIHSQNAMKFLRVNPSASIGQFDANIKSWAGQTTFAMVQTLSKEKNLIDMPPMDLLVIDEAHHSAASSFKRVIDSVKEKNPEAAIYGVTATVARSDRKGLRHVFDNVCDQITIREQIQAGYLVPPITFGIDLGVQQQLEGLEDPDDMDAVAAIMDHKVINDKIVEHWKEKAGDRKTIVFCSTVAHAYHLCESFTKQGINAAVIHGDLKGERKQLLHEFDRGDLQVLLNCFVLTEGYDSQPVSCVVLTRPSSHISTFTQMVGRGLRTVDPEEYPGVVKKDCILLDFGTSAHTHQTLDQSIDLDGTDGDGKPREKECFECNARIPMACKECPLCGADLQAKDDELLSGAGLKSEKPLSDFTMSEIDLLARSSFEWMDLFGKGDVFLATGFDAWAGVFFMEDFWYAVGGKQKQAARLLASGDKTLCMAAADDWLNNYESEDAAKKSKRWLNQSATPQQLKYIPEHKNDFGLTRYHASCLMVFKFNKHAIRQAVYKAARMNHQQAVA